MSQHEHHDHHHDHEHDLPKVALWAFPAILVGVGAYGWSDIGSGALLVPLRIIGGALFVLGLTLAVIAFNQSQQIKRRLARGECVRCGADMRSSPEKCPQCGHEPHLSHPTNI